MSMPKSKTVYGGMTDAEKKVASYLQDLDLWRHHEFPVFVFDDNDRPRVWSPDFYLTELGIYVEVCGSPDFDYGYRKRIYQKNKIPVIFVEAWKDDAKWQTYLVIRIDEIEQARSELVKTMMRTWQTSTA
jgi:hypothetical protein